MDTNQGSLRQVGAESAVKITIGGGELPQPLVGQGCCKQLGIYLEPCVDYTGEDAFQNLLWQRLRPR